MLRKWRANGMNVCDDSSIYLGNRENMRRSDTRSVIAPFVIK